MGRKDWYNDNKDKDIRVVGATFQDRDSGRITHEIYIKGPGKHRVVAEEGYHTVVRALRIASPDDFGRVERWAAQRPEQRDQSVEEDFAQTLSLIEVGDLTAKKSGLPADIVDRAQKLFDGSEQVPPGDMDIAKIRIPKGKSPNTMSDTKSVQKTPIIAPGLNTRANPTHLPLGGDRRLNRS